MAKSKGPVERVLRIWVACPRSLYPVIAHLLHRQPGLGAEPRPVQPEHLSRSASGPQPQITILDYRLLKGRSAEAVTSIKASAPRSKVILIYPDRDLFGAMKKFRADAYVEERALVARLVPAVQRLSR